MALSIFPVMNFITGLKETRFLISFPSKQVFNENLYSIRVLVYLNELIQYG